MNRRDVAPPGIAEAPTVPPGTKPKNYPALIAHQFRDLPSSEYDVSTLQKRITQISSLFDQLMCAHEHEVRSLKNQVGSLKAERDRKAARDLTVDSFDNSLDQVSEGQVKSAVETLNNNLDEFVMNITEEVAGVPPLKTFTNDAISNLNNPLLAACSKLSIDDERRGLLVETMLHQEVVERLNVLFFQGKVCCNYADAAVLEHMHDKVISVKGKYQCLLIRQIPQSYSTHVESWKTAQRWRSVTSDAAKTMFGGYDSFATDGEKIAVKLVTLVLKGLERPSSSLPKLQKSISDGLNRLYVEAFTLATSIRRDHISARLQVVIAPSTMKTIDSRFVDVQWADSSRNYKTNKSLGTYSFGILKIGEGGKTTVLLRPKVVADSLAHAYKSAWATQPTLNYKDQQERKTDVHRDASSSHVSSSDRVLPAHSGENRHRNTPSAPAAGTESRFTKEGRKGVKEHELKKTHQHEGAGRNSQNTRKGGGDDHSPRDPKTNRRS
jgi:hypothetical protein